MQITESQISKFGGDPKKVTIWGLSAGAGSVLQHVVANGGKTKPPLFRAAMTSSTFLPSQYKYNDQIPEVSAAKLQRSIELPLTVAHSHLDALCQDDLTSRVRYSFFKF